MTLKLEPKAGFDWSHVTWGHPDSIVSVLCSYCSASMSDDGGRLMMWAPDGRAAQFCPDCQRRWWGMEGMDEDEG